MRVGTALFGPRPPDPGPGLKRFRSYLKATFFKEEPFYMGLMDELRRLARPYEDEDEEYDEELEEETTEEEEEPAPRRSFRRGDPGDPRGEQPGALGEP